MSIKSSGIPKASKPEITDFTPVEKLDERTKGMRSGLRKPVTNTIIPTQSLAVGGFLDVFFILSNIINQTLL